MLNPITVGCVEHRNIFFVRHRCKFTVTWIKSSVDQRLWQIHILPIVAFPQLNSFDAFGNAVENR